MLSAASCGHALLLIIIGVWDCLGAYRRHLRRVLECHRDWVRLAQDISREEVVCLLEASRYGLHGMVGEQFGMAVAEMQRAGCIFFVPHMGGPVEIVGHEPRVLYASVEEAVTKMDAVLRDPGLQMDLYHQALRQRELFTTEALCARCRRVSASLCRHQRARSTSHARYGRGRTGKGFQRG